MTTKKLMAAVAFVAFLVWEYVEWSRLSDDIRTLVLMGLVYPTAILVMVVSALILPGLAMADKVRTARKRRFHGRR